MEQWLSQGKAFEPNVGLFDAMRTRFERSRDSILQTVDVRSKDRLKHLSNTLEGRKQKEIDNITVILDELQKTIQTELSKESEPEQLKLFTDDERLQLRRDNEALRARLARIPDEREKEIEAIEGRYAGFTDRTFPVAVIFLVPESVAKGATA